MIKDIEQIKGKRIGGWVGFFILEIISFSFDNISNNITLFFMIAGLVSLIYGLVAKSDAQKKLIEVFNKLKSNKSVFASVKNEDFDFEALGV
jgi:hypothetical protein